MKIALFITATGKYTDFLPKLIETADTHFLTKYEVTYIIFTSEQLFTSTHRRVKQIAASHQKFPEASMNRCCMYASYIQNQVPSFKYDYCFAIDADAYFSDTIGDEILKSTVAVNHCAYVNIPGPFETNIESACFIANTNNKTYFGGGFYGGETAMFYDINHNMHQLLKKDKESNIIPIWHDETALNKYFNEKPPKLILSPSYHWPEFDPGKLNPWVASLWEKQKGYIMEKWGVHPPFSPKISLIEKSQTGKPKNYYRN